MHAGSGDPQGSRSRHRRPEASHPQSNLPSQARIPHTYRLGSLRSPLYVHFTHRHSHIEPCLAAEAQERAVSVEKLNDLVREQGGCLSFGPPFLFLIAL